MSRTRVCFLGTPAFAVTCLQALLEDPNYEVVGILTQPDRPSGRKLQLTPSPVKLLANDRGIPVYSPESLKSAHDVVDEVKKWNAEVAVVVAFGQILTDEFMNIFPLGAVNVHASLLPKWRGAAPIQRSIEAGDEETGVCLQKMVKRLDAGAVIGSRKIKLDMKITAMELHDQLAVLGADLLHIELKDYIRGNLIPVPQNEDLVTLAQKISKEESHIPWNLSAEEIHNRIRAFTMGPGSYFIYNSKRVKVHRSEVVNSEKEGHPAHVSTAENDDLCIETKKGIIRFLSLQPESKSKMSAKEFLAGHPVKVGDILQ